MESLIKFKKFIDEINSNNSRNYKLEVLKKYKDDEDIKYYLEQVYNPYIVFGISEKKLERAKTLDPHYYYEHYSIVFNSVKEVLEYIKENNTGKDEILYNIESFKTYNFYSVKDVEEEKLYVELEKLFDLIICKNLQLGIDTKSINKIIPNLIPTFNVMLANKYFDDPSKVEGKEFAITTKIDGMRCIMMKENSKVTFWSRQGKQIEGLVDLEKEALELLPDNICLDGELVAAVDNPDTYKDTICRARNKNPSKTGLKLKVFDFIPLTDFKNQKCDLKYFERRQKLEDLFK